MSFSKQCAKCNTSFECRVDEQDCWCMGYTVSTENLELLKTQFTDCLCPACLAEYRQKDVPATQ